MTTICLHCIVSGRVQGVFYRDSTRKKAIELGVNGWIKNRADGRVELVACGERHEVEQLQQWLWKGPLLASVSEVTAKEVPCEHHSGFTISND